MALSEALNRSSSEHESSDTMRFRSVKCLRCGAKTVTFLFWVSLYMLVMKMTLFKTSSSPPIKEWSFEPDNYSKWLVGVDPKLQGPVLGEDEGSGAGSGSSAEWAEPDNATVAELARREWRVRRVCRRRALLSQPINNKEFFVDHVHNLVWCNIFKAASSSWLYNFNILGGYSKKYLARTRLSPLTNARKKYPRPSLEELLDAVETPGVVTLLVVREPFVRLLSAYRDKLENVAPLYYRKLAKAIVAAHRAKATEKLGPIKSFGPTFFEFVAYLIERHQKRDDATFDEHWTPYYQFCSPCAVNFTVISKVETLQRDTAFVVQQLGLVDILGRRALKRRTRIRTVMNKSRDGKNTTALLRHYFSQLDERMLKGLLDIYSIDFEMFGYDPKVYSSYVRK